MVWGVLLLVAVALIAAIAVTLLLKAMEEAGRIEPGPPMSQPLVATWGVPIVSSTEAGSATVGSTDYPIPADGVFVAPNGVDTASGTADDPVKTVARGIQLAPAGGTVILRAGDYHESITVVDKPVTIQSAPHEPVWFDGSTVIQEWDNAGGNWVQPGWTAEFDASPTFTRGAPDSADPGWRNVSADHPLAAHPDQVWIDGVAQHQVGSVAAVKNGTFYVDYAAHEIYLGSDPHGHEVRASDLVMAIAVQTPGVTVRGIGVRGYGTPLPEMGTVRIDQPGAGATIENVVIRDNATAGLSISAPSVAVRSVTTARNGYLGIHGNHADGLRVSNTLVSGNNTEHFLAGPVAGGMKVTRARDVAVAGSEFVNNDGAGLWCDESCHDFSVTNSTASGNKTGVVFELSAKALIANNRIRDNSYAGIIVHNAEDARIWNNAVSGSRLTLFLNQDARSPDSPSAVGRDDRQPFPDPDISWITRDIEVSNNVFTAPAGDDLWCGLVCVYDQTGTRPGDQMGLTFDGNVYHRTAQTMPPFLIRWSVIAPGNTWRNFDTLADFAAATGQEARSTELTGPSPLMDDGELRPVQSALHESVGLPIPATVAELTGLSAGERRVGPSAAE